ncbi:hypothetical protein [Cupriavidus yeoncheonensis]|uniref:hypothetical protein n=1 Tax=Cupriavidus yeoncheonensis TaxID=1462994 RepID=UPI001BA649B0|nr:hypothetical protein [Cupriavidus yeoncheonensis]
MAIILGTAGVGLWRYVGAGRLASYAERAVVFGDSDLHLPPAIAGNTGRIRVVHFWDPDCTCDKEMDAHLNFVKWRHGHGRVSGGRQVAAWRYHSRNRSGSLPP